MRTQANITDRAHRYRAQQNMPQCEKRCHFCGNPGNGSTADGRPLIFVGHVSGDESDGSADNLTWTCRSCNSIASNTLHNAGRGRRTDQYNPTKSGGAANVWECTLATACIVPHKGAQYSGDRYGVPCEMSTADAVRMIRATPHHKRSEFARKIWSNRKGRRMNPAKFDRCVKKVSKLGGGNAYAICTARGVRNSRMRLNPAEQAHEAYKAFHGFYPKIHEVVEQEIRYHGHLFGVGELVSFDVIRLDGEIITLEDFDGAMLSGNECSEGKERGSQLYIKGGDQSVSLPSFGIRPPYKDLEYLGEATEVRYYTEKTHLGKEGGLAEYYHELAEEGPERYEFGQHGEFPRMIYDTMNKQIMLAGGEYSITPEGIRN